MIPIATLGVVRDLSQMPYITVGNWSTKESGIIEATSLDLSNPDYNFLIALHELVEAVLCKKHGVAEEAVTAFDVQFETERLQGLHDDDDEAGDDPRAPYRHQHRVATILEWLIARELGVDWSGYETAILNALK